MLLKIYEWNFIDFWWCLQNYLCIRRWSPTLFLVLPTSPIHWILSLFKPLKPIIFGWNFYIFVGFIEAVNLRTFNLIKLKPWHSITSSATRKLKALIIGRVQILLSYVPEIIYLWSLNYLLLKCTWKFVKGYGNGCDLNIILRIF